MNIISSLIGNPEAKNPITAFNFVLEVEGIYFLPIKSVRAFTKENEYEYIKEGGVNDYIHMKRKPISKPFTFQIEQYVGTERILDPLANGTELVLPLILHVYRHKAMAGFSDFPDAFPARLYTFTGCTVISKEYGELNAERSSILTEITTIAYRELMVVTNPFDSTQELEPYSISTDKTKNKYAATIKSDKTKSEFDKPQYEMKEDKTKNKYAKLPDNNGDKPVVKEQYEMQVDKAVNKYAEKSNKDSEKPKVKAQYEMKKDKNSNKYAEVSGKDSEKPEQKAQYEMKKDGTGNKYAQVPPNNSERAPQVTWPPTRRALMAEALSKK